MLIAFLALIALVTALLYYSPWLPVILLLLVVLALLVYFRPDLGLALAVFAGAFVALGLWVLLYAFGLAVGLMMVARLMLDAVDHMMEVQFTLVQRDDITVLFHDPRGAAALMILDRQLEGLHQPEHAKKRLEDRVPREENAEENATLTAATVRYRRARKACHTARPPPVYWASS